MSGRSSRASQTQEKIIDAALELFGKRGFRGSTTREIAERAGVNEVTLFRHFRSKKELFTAVVERRSPLNQIERVAMLVPEGTVEEMLFRNMKTVLDILRSNRHFMAFMLSDAWRFPDTRELLYRMGVQRGIDLVSDMFQLQIESGAFRKVDPRSAARALMGAVQFHFIANDLLEGRKSEPVDEDKVLRTCVSILLDGLRAKGGERVG